MKHLNIKILGRVQGVFFRAEAKKKADTLGIKGFVRNESDSSVYIEAEGNDGSLGKFLKWVESGTDSAEIENIETDESSPKNFLEFEIR